MEDCLSDSVAAALMYVAFWSLTLVPDNAAAKPGLTKLVVWPRFDRLEV